MHENIDVLSLNKRNQNRDNASFPELKIKNHIFEILGVLNHLISFCYKIYYTRIFYKIYERSFSVPYGRYISIMNCMWK